LDNPSSQLVVPAIVIAEALFIIERGKAVATPQHLWSLVIDYANVSLYPLDLEVLQETESLTVIPEIHDRQIVATALVLRDPETETVILTRDEKITSSGVVKTLW
jgi:hypothetical protein